MRIVDRQRSAAEAGTDSLPRLDCTVVVFAHNAAERVRVLVEGLKPLVAEVVVCDIGSADETVSFALAAGARVIEREWVPVVEALRQEVIDSIEARWLLILDDDEVPDRHLLRSLANIIAADSADVVSVCLLSYFFGEVLRCAGYEPTNVHHSQVRLFKKGAVHASTRIHKKLGLAEGARYRALEPQDGYLHHFSYESVSQWLVKTDRYTDAEADWIVSNVLGRPLPSLRFALGVLVEPVSLIVRHRALSGGWRGLAMVIFMLNYRVTAWAKAKERVDGHGPGAARLEYLRKGRELLGLPTDEFP